MQRFTVGRQLHCLQLMHIFMSNKHKELSQMLGHQDDKEDSSKGQYILRIQKGLTNELGL